VGSNADVRTLTTPQELFAAAAEEVVRSANEAVKQRGRFTIALSGGSTPKNLYNLLATNARSSLPWEQMFFFWSDERHVPPDNEESNYRMSNEAMLSKIPVAQSNIFRVESENPDANVAAEAYEKTIRKFFGSERDQVPVFDLILLGLGPDGHTASLFPGTKALQEKSKLVVANWVEKFKTNRITFTLPLLDGARSVTFLVSGTDKAPALREVLQGSAAGEQFPAKLVQPSHGRITWLIDRAAGSELSS
jgi:6-phosphogluconolactonase